MTAYIGRFAPSPTGPLHFGSLLAALASYLDARAHQGQWLLRMEDLDPPREQAGAAQAILDALRAHGLHWDGEIMWQSQRKPAYAAALMQLLKQHHAFYCDCSRSQLQAQGGAYPGTCRQRQLAPDQGLAVRAQVTHEPVGFDDAIQGLIRQDLALELGDFVILRRDGLYAYQLAVVVDDAAQGITDIVRGADLLDSTPRQIHLQRLLGLPTPRYAHIPVAGNHDGQKLSKQTHAAPLEPSRARDNLIAALAFLGQAQPPPDTRHSVDALLHWGIAHWQLRRIPRQRLIPVN